MKATRAFRTVVLILLLSCRALSAQAPQENGSSLVPQPAPALEQPARPAGTDGVAPGLGLSDWITYNGHRRLCCEPVGDKPPVAYELFVRAGPTKPFGGTLMGDLLQTGWMIDSGVRGVWFEPARDRAWIFTASISNSNNSSSNQADSTPIAMSKLLQTTTNIGGSPVVKRFTIAPTLSDWNRTFVNAGFGHDWFYGSLEHDKYVCRWGVDGGGRYGTSRAGFTSFPAPAQTADGFTAGVNTIRHATDVIGGAWAALHGDIEIGCGCCVFVAGLRTEWAWTWSDILQRTSDLQELNLLGGVGVRY